MPLSSEEIKFKDYVVDLMQPLGDVSAKAMFGGFGVFLNGLMFALIAESVLYFKVDDETETVFQEKGLESFTYSKKGKLFKMSYYEAPAETLEDIDEMKSWATQAYETALRVSSKKPKH
jgi:DNA transformation protein and related proteins